MRKAFFALILAMIAFGASAQNYPGKPEMAKLAGVEPE
jgi:hypothetical protein